MKKRFTAFVLTFGMLINQSMGIASAAESEKNAYGHLITYEPVTQLYTGGEPVKFFDAGVTEWGKLSDKIIGSEAESIKWLRENNYLLNHFGRYFNGADMTNCFNSKGEWQTQLKGPRNVRRWDANVRFSALADKEQRENGNISNMFDKGDVQYFFSWKVKTVQTKWGLTDKSNDIGYTYALDGLTISNGGGWKKYHTLKDGPNLGDFSAWKNSENLNIISFTAISDKDAQVDSYLSGAMLVGRDVKGPRIDSVRVTADIDGKNEIENGTVTLDNADKLNDRTVYFRVTWDEPVVFNGKSSNELKNLSLKVNTVGIDGTSGIIAEAPFLKFAPSKKDGKPTMIFEYKIADPYTDSSSVTQERGYFYKFSSVTVSEKENETLWNNIYDISGNKFASDENGLQPAGKVVAPVSSVKVDLMPFGIKSIQMTKTDDSAVFIKPWETFGITLNLNKPLAKNVKKDDLPKIVLNVTDSDGENITLQPYDYGTDFIKYRTRFYPGHKTDGKSVGIISVSSGKNKVKDDSGYTLMNYTADSSGILSPADIPSGAENKIAQYSISPDKQYKLDFDAPVIEVSASETSDGIILITAIADDASAEGCDAAFTVRANGRTADGGMYYQAASSESYNDSAWQKGAADTLNVSFSSPLINKNGKCTAYGFIRLPQKSEADKIDISIFVSDEAGNSASAEKSFSSPEWNGSDTLAPTVSLSVIQENIIVDISDMDDEITYMYGFSEDENTEPSSYTSASGKSGTLTAPDLPEGNMIHTRVLWLKAKDSHGNESDVSKLSVNYDRTYTEINWKADTEKQYFSGEYPFVEFTVANAVSYWYVWAEKPANVSDTAAYIADNYLEDMKSRAEKYNCVFDPTVITLPVTELTGNTPVAEINSADESYGADITPAETSRPIMLIIAAEKREGGTLVKTLEFNTVYGAPKASVQQRRFSTNDSVGKRVDYIRDAEKSGLIWASDTDKYEYPLNTPNLYGFAQAEFNLCKDPVTAFDRVDTANSSVTLEKVVYEGTGIDGAEKERTVIEKWNLSDLNFGGILSSESAIVDIDLSKIEPEYSVTDDDMNTGSVRYEFVCNMSYIGGIPPESKPITYFAFNNTPKGYINSTWYDTGRWMSRYRELDNYEMKNTEAVFDRNGNDVTAGIPVYTVMTSYPETSGYNEFIRFSAAGGSYSESDIAYYGAPVQNTVDTNNTSKLAVHIGTDPENLTDVLAFQADSYEVMSEPFDIGKYLFGDESEIREVKLYYRFEHPERGNTSPLYVMKIRRDNTEPLFDISISETERRTNEVLVKVNSLSDTQTAPDGTTVVDTPNPNMIYGSGEVVLDAWREAVKSDDLDSIPPEEQMSVWSGYDEATDTHFYKDYVRVVPDGGGIYHFISNGYFTPDAQDNAGNRSTSIMVNGEMVEVMSDGMDFPRYYINNVSNVPPEFTEEPAFTEDSGKFSVKAKTDQTVKNVYLKFDKTYSNLLTEDEPADDAKYNINNVPGIVSGGFNSETGEIDAEIYVKYSDSVQLTSAVLVIEDSAGNKNEYTYSFKSPLCGIKPEITNAKNENGYPVYSYGETLDFSVPVKLGGTDTGYCSSHADVAVYSDGITQIEYTDLFGESRTENVYADIFGAAFNHSLVFTANGNEITPQTPVSSDIQIRIDTSKTKNLSVDGGKTEFTLSENKILNYSLTNSELGQTREFNIPIINIDKTAPEAIISFNAEIETDVETGAKQIYSATYSIEGFSEDGVTLIPSADGAVPSSVTFEYGSAEKEYTFRFRDAAGNEGSYTADASDIAFAQRADNKITDYRLTYTATDENGFRTVGQFGINDKVTDIAPLNRAVSVKIEALNQNGETVSSAISANGSLPQGTALYAKEKLVMFTTESSEERAVNLTLTGTGSENSINALVVLPANTIDLTAPSGTVYYKPDGDAVKAYLVTQDTDLAENGVYVTGTKADGTAFELKSDENGYYTELDINGAGRFIMTDKAGNVGTVAIAVLTIDKEPPQIISEGWQSLVDARTREEIAELLAMPTNSSIKLFMTFNEQLSGAEVKAFKSMGEAEELRPTDEYVTAAASGSTLTVEFMQNCRAKLTVYDLRGNALTLWRPEDGPITVIDRDAPKLAEGYPSIVFDKENNVVKIEYVFADGEEVMLLQNHEDGYKNRHIVTADKNGSHIFNFADRAGNVFSDYPVISEIDGLAPNIKMNMDFVGNGAELSGNDSYIAGNFYTSKDVRILLNVTDTTADGITVTAETKSGTPISVKAENIDLDGKSYNYSFVVSENGSYKVTAKDKWGHENSVETNISVIDKTAPTIKFGKNAVVINTGISEDDAKAKILEDITAADLQSGATSPMGDKSGSLKNTTPGIKISADISKVSLDKEGTYTAIITAEDRLGNTAEKTRTVTVVKDVYTFTVNGALIYANDVFTSAKGTIRLHGSSETAKYYYAKGYKTAAQMKYANGFNADEGFDASQNGYYTILAQESNRKMYLLYVYIY